MPKCGKATSYEEEDVIELAPVTTSSTRARLRS
jgi:hypothetical protein